MDENENPQDVEITDEDYLGRTEAASRAGAPGGPEQSLWDSDDALDSLRMERSVQGDEAPADQTKRMLEEAGPMAAASIIHIALHSANDNTRLSASRYIIDFNRESGIGEGNYWEKLVADVIGDAELLANQPGGRA